MCCSLLSSTMFLRLAIALLGAVVCVLPAAAQAPSNSPPPAVKVGYLLGDGSQPFTYTAPDGQPAGFEVELMRALCSSANLSCQFQPIGTLEDRVAAVANGSVDAVIGQLTYTPGRAIVVSYVQPFYYSTGTVLLTRPSAEAGGLLGLAPPTKIAASANVWRSLAGRRVCFLKGYYATAFIVDKYKVEPVTVDNVPDGVSQAESNGCMGFAFTSTYQQSAVQGLEPLAGAAPVYTSPYGIAVAKGNRALQDKLSAALVGAMGQGNESSLVQLEKMELVNKGVPANSNLQEVVRAITSFGAGTGGEDEVPSSYTQNVFGNPLSG